MNSRLATKISTIKYDTTVHSDQSNSKLKAYRTPTFQTQNTEEHQTLATKSTARSLIGIGVCGKKQKCFIMK